MLKVTYFGNLNDHAITEYLCVLHDGYAGYKAMERLKVIAGKVGVDYMVQPSLDALCDELGRSSAPTIAIPRMASSLRLLIGFGE